jgi:hypothetical protein
LRTSGKSPLTSDIMSKEIPEISFHTFPDSHGRDGAFDGILAFFSIFAIQVDAELIIFSLSRCPYAHRDSKIGGRQ